jgi:hypothetical protein
MSSSPTLGDIDLRQPITIVIKSRVFSPDGTLTAQDRAFINSLSGSFQVWVQSYMAETAFTPVAPNRDYTAVLSTFKEMIGNHFGQLVFTERMHGFSVGVARLHPFKIETLQFYLERAARMPEGEGYQAVRTLHPQTLHLSLNGTGIHQTMAGVKARSEGSKLIFIDLEGAANGQPAEADCVMTVENWESAWWRLTVLAMRREHILRAPAEAPPADDRQA